MSTARTVPVPEAIALSPDGKNAYVTSEGQGALSQFAISPVTGKITPLVTGHRDRAVPRLTRRGGHPLSGPGREGHRLARSPAWPGAHLHHHDHRPVPVGSMAARAGRPPARRDRIQHARVTRKCPESEPAVRHELRKHLLRRDRHAVARRGQRLAQPGARRDIAPRSDGHDQHSHGRTSAVGRRVPAAALVLSGVRSPEHPPPQFPAPPEPEPTSHDSPGTREPGEPGPGDPRCVAAETGQLAPAPGRPLWTCQRSGRTIFAACVDASAWGISVVRGLKGGLAVFVERADAFDAVGMDGRAPVRLHHDRDGLLDRLALAHPDRLLDCLYRGR